MPRLPLNEIDRHIGMRIRKRRKDWRISQEALATALGVSFQQVQKYEDGTNKVAASLLFKIAHQLQMPISYFFSGLGAGEITEDTPPPKIETPRLSKLQQ